MTLKTDYKDYQFQEGETLRKYRQISNGDGTISLEDVTVYQQEGDRFSASDINSTNAKVNELDQGVSGLQTNVSTLKSDTYFSVGETLSISQPTIVTGFVNATSQILIFVMELPKSLKNITSITINSLNSKVRINPYFKLSGTTLDIGGGTYLTGDSNVFDLVTTTTSINYVINKELNCIELKFTKSDKWNCTGNTNCTVEITSGSITFN